MNNDKYIDHLNNYIKNYVYISKNFDFMFYTIYKNASTKISEDLGENVYIINKTTRPRIQEKKIIIAHNNKKILDDLKKHNIKNIFKIAFVRNPIDRYISLFNYFKGMKRGKLMHIYNETDINDWTINYFSKNYDKLEFVSNCHFNSQSSFLIYNGTLICDEIMKLENIDYEKLESKNIKLTKKIINKFNKNKITLNDQSISIIKKIYMDDFNNFYENCLL